MNKNHKRACVGKKTKNVFIQSTLKQRWHISEIPSHVYIRRNSNPFSWQRNCRIFQNVPSFNCWYDRGAQQIIRLFYMYMIDKNNTKWQHPAAFVFNRNPEICLNICPRIVFLIPNRRYYIFTEVPPQLDMSLPCFVFRIIYSTKTINLVTFTDCRCAQDGLSDDL